MYMYTLSKWCYREKGAISMSGPFYKGLKIIKYLQLKNMCRHLILKPKQKEPDLRSDDVYK